MWYEHCTLVCTTGGLQESTGTFAQFSRQVEEEDQDESKPPPVSSAKIRQRVSPTNSTEAPVKKKTLTKKPKIQKYDFDEFVREVGHLIACDSKL